jgi:thymidine kinase
MAKLYFYFSAMNAGKTTTLLQSAHNYRERGMRVAILTPKLDFRAGSGTVASRIGLQAEGIAFERTDDLRTSSMPTSPRTVRCIACWSTKRNSSARRRPGS